MRGYVLFQSFFESSAQQVGTKYRWSPDYCKTIAYETFKALYCKSTVIDPMKLSVSPAIDQVWHQMVLETETYSKMCVELFHRFIHHSTITIKDDIRDKHNRQKECMAIYEKCFGPIAAPECWKFEEERPKKKKTTIKKKSRKRTRDDDIEQSHIYIVDILGDRFNIPYDVSDTILDIKMKAHDRGAVPADEQRLVFAGKQLNDDLLLDHYQIPKESTIHLIRRLKGC